METPATPRGGELRAAAPSPGAEPRGRRARYVVLSLAICFLASFAAGLSAKEKRKVSKTITGVVLDATENPIVGATVELTDTYTKKKVAIYSEDGGHFEFIDLDPNHDYELEALNKNISSGIRKVSSLDDREKIVVVLRVPPPKE